MNDLYRRLEAVTSRLEDIYESARTGAPAPASAPAASPSAAIPAAKPPPSSALPPPPVIDIEDPPAVKAYFDEIADTKVKQFTKLTESFAAPSVVEQVYNRSLILWCMY